MGRYVANVLKKKVKQLYDGYVKLKEEKKNKKQRKREACDKSGFYRAEPSEHLYEKLSFMSECQNQSDDRNATSNKASKLSFPIACSSKNSSNDSQANLLDSPCSSLDSGISSSPPGFKKLKKLQFSTNSDEIYVFERNPLERRSYKEPCLNEEHMEAQLCKAKVYEVPIAEKAKIIDQDLNTHPDAKGSCSFSELTSEIPFHRLRIKESIVSPKTYQKTIKETNKTASPNTFLGNFAQRHPQDTPRQNLANCNKQNLCKPEFQRETSRKSFKKYNTTYESDILTPLLESPPEKPPRSIKDLRKIYFDSSQNTTNADNIEQTSPNSKLRNSVMDKDEYSIPFDMRKEYTEISSTPVKDLSSSDNEPEYAQIISKSSRGADQILSSTPTDVAKIKSDTKHIYGLVTPQNSRNLKQESPEQTHSENEQNSENYFTCSSISPIVDVNSTLNNDIMSKECKEKLNIIHKINWSLQKGDISHEHECHSKSKNPEEVGLEEKFVINMFESRPSKRWEKHIRDGLKRNPDKEFNKNTWNRLSLDSKKSKPQCLEANVQIINNNFADVEIEKLEIESKNLKDVSKKIEKELNRMEQENNEAYSRTLEKEKLRIEKQMNQLNNNIDEASIKLTSESKRIETELEQIKSQSTEDYIKYKRFKKSRDIECARMTQASRALEEIINRRGKKDWLEVLVAERTLLETSEKVRVLTQQIRDNTYTTIPEPPLHKGTIYLNGIKFPFAKQFQGNTKREKHHTDFFVMTLSYGTQIFVSEFITGECDPLSFSRIHAFKNVKPDFEIKVQLFHIRLRTSDVYFWEKFSCYNLCPTSQIIYEDLLTHQFQEKTVYKTSFKLCAETTLTRTNINEVSVRLHTKSEVFCKLNSQMEFNLKCENIDIVARLSGFLDVGTLCGETYFWEKKWCVLDGPNLMIFNYPQEEDFGKPCEQINLEYCFGPINTKVENCPKRRSFYLKTGRPNNITNQNAADPKVHTLKTKPNFTLRKFFFAASNMEEYLQWTMEVEKILNSLSDFKKLAFGEEYVEYLR